MAYPPLVNLPARLGLVTLACRDVERMASLFRDLGWPETPESDEHHRTFQCTNGVVLGLYAATHYEPDFGPPTREFRGFTLCVNLASLDEVRAAYETLLTVPDIELLGIMLSQRLRIDGQDAGDLGFGEVGVVPECEHRALAHR